MRAITVAIADEDEERRTRFERSLQGEQDIRLLTNRTAEGRISQDRRLRSRANITRIDDVVARSRRLKPRILFASLQQCTDANCSMLSSLRSECPETLVVMLADESDQHEERILQALASGARGYLNPGVDALHISKAVRVIDRGEAWVPRKMLGKIMDQVLHRSYVRSMEVQVDSAS